MTKNDLITKISKDNGTTKKDAEIAIDNVFEAIKDIILSGEEVYIFGFGKFTVADFAARMERNPKTGEAAEVPAKKVIKFCPAKNIAEDINK